MMLGFATQTGISGLIAQVIIDVLSDKTPVGITRILVSIMWATIAIVGAIRGLKR